MQIPGGFNVDKEAKGYKAGFELIEPGWHKVVIVHSDIKDTKANNGKYVEFKYEIQEDAKRTLIDRLNVINPSDVTVKIGKAALGKIAQSAGLKGELKDTKDIHGKPFFVKVAIKPAKDDPEKKFNEIKGYKSLKEMADEPQHETEAPTEEAPSEEGAPSETGGSGWGDS